MNAFQTIDTQINYERARFLRILHVKEKYGLWLVIVLGYILSIFCAGIAGMIIYGIYTQLDGPIWVRNQFIGLWLSALNVFYSCQAVYLLKKSRKNIKNFIFYVDIFYFGLCCLASLCIAICYGFAKKYDAIVWSIFILFSSCLSILILFNRRHSSLTIILENDENELMKSHSNKCVTCIKNTWSVLNALLKIIFLIILCFLVVSSVIIGALRFKYPPRGKFVTAPLADNSNRKITLHYLCDGPKNDSFPVYMFEGDATHGMGDYYGLQILLKQKNRRSCIWDKAGAGYSDYIYADLKNDDAYYHNFISAIGERPPFIMAGWGGGGDIIYRYASSHPNMIYSLTFLDVSPPKIEWIIPKILNNWTQNQYDNNVHKDMSNRRNLINLINGIGVPFGIMKLFYPTDTSYPPELRAEKVWFYLIDKSWATQAYFLKGLPTASNSFISLNLSSNISVNQIMTVKSDEQIINDKCKPFKWPSNSSNCEFEIKSNRLAIDLQRNLLKFNQVVNCTFDKCNLGYYINDAQYTVETLEELYKNVSLKRDT